MRILQLIDSLEPGGAERVAVTYANVLADHVESSFLCATRKEGLLKDELSDKVGYLFLKKSSSTDLKALLKLKKFIKTNNIGIIHAHTTSYFLASQLKMTMPKLKIVWHEHHGARVHQSRKDNMVLIFCARFFHRVVTVNLVLNAWWKNYVPEEKLSYLPNAIKVDKNVTGFEDRPKEIVCLANLREPKNHLNLLRAFKRIIKSHPDWHLKLIGTDFKDSYTAELKEFISTNEMQKCVIILGKRSNAGSLLQEARIGVLSSDSEGLPMALLEYGMAELAVVTTDVGNCSEVISTFGKTVPKGNPNALASSIMNYIENEELCQRDAANFRSHILEKYSIEALLPQLLEIYRN